MIDSNWQVPRVRTKIVFSCFAHDYTGPPPIPVSFTTLTFIYSVLFFPFAYFISIPSPLVFPSQKRATPCSPVLGGLVDRSHFRPCASQKPFRSSLLFSSFFPPAPSFFNSSRCVSHAGKIVLENVRINQRKRKEKSPRSPYI